MFPLSSDIPTIQSELAEIYVPGTTTLPAAGKPRKRPRVAAHSANTVPTSMGLIPLSASLATESDWLSALDKNARRIGALEAGWDGAGSVPIKRGLLDEATRLVKLALAGLFAAACPYLVPGGDGSLQVEWHEKDCELEFDLAVDGTYSIWIHDRRSGEEIEGENEKALALFSRWAPRVATLSNDEIDVLRSSNTSIYGAIATFPIYQNDTVS